MHNLCENADSAQHAQVKARERMHVKREGEGEGDLELKLL